MLEKSKIGLRDCAVQIWRTGAMGLRRRKHIPLASKVTEAAAVVRPVWPALRGLSVALQLAMNGLC
jgi:hypothetical protein